MFKSKFISFFYQKYLNKYQKVLKVKIYINIHTNFLEDV